MDNKQKLKSNRDFRKTYDKGRSFANKYLVIFFVKNNLENNRIGIAVTKKIGKSVVRNKIRRRIREAYRLNSGKVKQGYDIIFLSRANAKEVGYNEIESALLHLLKLAGLLKKGD
ncbi:ribonuclease P protein component [Proteiniborus ethanoligenes]|uniref:Ribonuclease P protein component n=1 Tax=Proteiniborus ethanoligenes TaxID=415015 RepID=A0A1H3NM33_9FIRM|nr:ribonuclease P protein component [Proteiniborus ethanoligenes]TAH60030.1 MAG: ribonuclease P protein component [Gottschalkiaceae bacterium]SDY89485.1 ribonuclease P protein component [Proteiniborus ethanoligenes]